MNNNFLQKLNDPEYRIKPNIISNTDSYKLSHWKMLPDGTERVSSYGECRVGSEYDYTIFHGLQPIIIKWLCGVTVEQWMIDEMRIITNAHLGSEEFLFIQSWQIIVDEFGGKLPLEIRAVKEGAKVPVGNALFKIVDTDPKKRFGWLTNYFETLIQKVWYPMAVATRSHNIVSSIKEFVKTSSDNEDFWKFMLHDFGLRSATCEEAGEISGAAHLVNSLGTDCVPALRYLNHFYGAEYDSIAYSVAATEHSIQNAYGHTVQDQIDYVLTLLKRFPDGILSIVCDGAEGGIQKFVAEVIPAVADAIRKRSKNSDNPLTKVVFRPDSPRFENDTPEDQMLWLCESLGDIFGEVENGKKFKVLNPCVGTILGDGLVEQDILDIYNCLIAYGWSAENVVVGQGGGLVQKLNRDTIRFAIKSAQQQRNGVWIPTEKKTSDKTKCSKSGDLKLVLMTNDDGVEEYQTINQDHPLFHDLEDQLIPVYRNGELLVAYTLEEVRANTGLWE